ncbi:hypothetical protein F8M41_000329 [Gigaspora margarita]|uniref:Uncharacterized protein n=1 Tax=Gigaspora margarita TaxID=4874 RepID=A0A8H3XJA1_GIGMA|nr:hypothetical protein F8M41_000329 [Gigaspora margarita]
MLFFSKLNSDSCQEFVNKKNPEGAGVEIVPNTKKYCEQFITVDEEKPNLIEDDSNMDAELGMDIEGMHQV